MFRALAMLARVTVAKAAMEFQPEKKQYDAGWDWASGALLRGNRPAVVGGAVQSGSPFAQGVGAAVQAWDTMQADIATLPQLGALQARHDRRFAELGRELGLA